MAESHVVSALVAKRAELAGEIELTRNRLGTTQACTTGKEPADESSRDSGQP